MTAIWQAAEQEPDDLELQISDLVRASLMPVEAIGGVTVAQDGVLVSTRPGGRTLRGVFAIRHDRSDIVEGRHVRDVALEGRVAGEAVSLVVDAAARIDVITAAFLSITCRTTAI